MSEFSDMLREAFVGEEPLDPHAGQKALENAVTKFDRRGRSVRMMAFFAVSFLGAVAIVAAILFFQSEDAHGLKMPLVWMALFFYGMFGVGLVKMWFAMMQNDLEMRKEVKRCQMLLIEILEGRDGQPSRSSKQ